MWQLRLRSAVEDARKLLRRVDEDELVVALDLHRLALRDVSSLGEEAQEVGELNWLLDLRSEEHLRAAANDDEIRSKKEKRAFRVGTFEHKFLDGDRHFF